MKEERVDYLLVVRNFEILFCCLLSSRQLDVVIHCRNVKLCEISNFTALYKVRVYFLGLSAVRTIYAALSLGTSSPAKARFGRPYGKNGRLGGYIGETGSRNMAATQKINFLTPVSYSLLQTLFR